MNTDHRQTSHTARSASSMLELLSLLSNNIVTVPIAAEHMGMCISASRKYIMELYENHIVVKVGPTPRGHYTTNYQLSTDKERVAEFTATKKAAADYVAPPRKHRTNVRKGPKPDPISVDGRSFHYIGDENRYVPRNHRPVAMDFITASLFYPERSAA